MYGLMLLLLPSAPIPAARPLPDLKPGVYRFKWGGSEWGTVTFREDGFYCSRYQVKVHWPDGQYLDCHYQGKWSWDPKTRQLTIEEVVGYYNPWTDKTLTKYVFEFGRKLDEGKSLSSTVHLRLYK